MKILTAEYLRSVLEYDQRNGVFIWRKRDGYPTFNKRFAGKIAGSVTSNGYWRILIDYKEYLAHRLAWLYVTGLLPLDEIDHRDRNKLNNRFLNLRESSFEQNQQNKGRQKNNVSGFKGVHRSAGQKKWKAIIYHNKKRTYLGIFDTPEEAHYFYSYAVSYYHREFGRVA